jgi:acyl-CoA synthetase (AMP-forming)/AMP-acid ligase II
MTGGWYRTGDLVISDHDGDSSSSARADELIISGASDIHPEEVQAILGTYPEVVDVAVVDLPDDRYGGLVVACAMSGSASAADLDAHCRTGGLADFKRPRATCSFPRSLATAWPKSCAANCAPPPALTTAVGSPTSAPPGTKNSSYA